MRGISFGGYEKSFRGTIDSEDLTENFRDINEDLVEAFNRERYINNRLYEYISDLSYQNQQLGVRIEELNTILVAASGHYADASGSLMTWSAYSDSEVVENTGAQDLSTGDVTLQWSRSWTKIPLILNEYGDYVTATSTNIAYDDGTESYLEKPDDIYDAFDNNPQTNWVREYLTGDAPGSVTVRVELPSSTNPAIDSIYAAPFPEGGPTITSVRYLTSDGTWTEVPGFSRTSGRRRWHFSPVDYNNQVDITLEPTTLTNSSSQQVKVFGLQDVDVSLIEYVDSSHITMKLDGAAGVLINNLSYIYLDYTVSPAVTEANLADNDKPIVLEIFEDAGLTTRVYSSLIYDHPYTGTLALGTPSASIWARITMRKINSTTPVVRELTIKYS